MNEIIHPANPFAETEFYYMVSTSVGSGKTTSAIRMIQEEPAQNFIYVAPTLKLLEQTYRDLTHTLQTKRKVLAFHTERTSNVTEAALGHINNTTPNMGAVIIITTKTFLTIMSMLQGKKWWKVVLDEAFDPLNMLTYRSKEYMSLCMDLFNEDEAGRVVPANGKGNLVSRIAYKDIADEQAYNNASIQDICEQVANKAIYCEWAKRTDGMATLAAYVAPNEFRGFREVYFLSALFEQSVLYHLWTRQHGVEFHESRRFAEDEKIINIHREQGPLVRVGHLLHPDDKASKYNLMRNPETGQRYEAGERGMVVDRALDIALEFVDGEPCIYQTNNWHRPRWDLPASATPVSVKVHGQNDYRDHINAIALAVTNPPPEVIHWLVQRTGLPEDQVYLAYRIHTTYQFFGRTGIRDRGDARVKTLLTAGKQDAEFIHKLFEGSLWLGQVGDLESMEAKGQERRERWLRRALGKDERYLKLRRQLQNVTKKVKRGTAQQTDLEAVKAAIADLKLTIQQELAAA